VTLNSPRRVKFNLFHASLLQFSVINDELLSFTESIDQSGGDRKKNISPSGISRKNGYVNIFIAFNALLNRLTRLT
jgi:hypothetical protein